MEQAARGAAQAEERSLEAHLHTLGRLESLRGGALIRERGRVRAQGRDGLVSLYEKGVLDQGELAAGLMYRQAFEAMERGPSSQLNREAIASTGSAQPMAWAERRAHLFGRLKQMEALAKTAAALAGLRGCAGEGRSIRSLSGGGRAHGAAVEALKAVLGQIAEERGLRRRTG